MSRPSEDVGQDVSEARSALRLRAILAGFGLLFGVVGTGVFVVMLADDSSSVEYLVGGLVCLAIALSAVIDLAVVRRRKHQREAMD